MWLQGHWLTILSALISLVVLVYLLLPHNWGMVGPRELGFLFRLNKPVLKPDGKPLTYGPGPVSYKWPFEKLKRVSLADITVTLDNAEYTTAEPNPINVTLSDIVALLRVGDPQEENAVKAVLAVPDGDPADEFIKDIQACLMQAVQSFTYTALVSAGGYASLSTLATNMVNETYVAKKWGLAVTSIRIGDVTLPYSITKASEDVIRASKQAEAAVARAQGQATAYQAMHDVMQDDNWSINRQSEAFEKAAQAGGVKTVLSAGASFVKGILGGDK